MRRTSLRAGVLGIGHWHALWHVAALQKMNTTTVGVWITTRGVLRSSGEKSVVPRTRRSKTLW